jgi:hypothetical protein
VLLFSQAYVHWGATNIDETVCIEKAGIRNITGKGKKDTDID